MGASLMARPSIFSRHVRCVALHALYALILCVRALSVHPQFCVSSAGDEPETIRASCCSVLCNSRDLTAHVQATAMCGSLRERRHGRLTLSVCLERF